MTDQAIANRPPEQKPAPAAATAPAAMTPPLTGAAARAAARSARSARSALQSVPGLGTPRRIADETLGGPPATASPAPWRASTVVVDVTGVHLPDGTVFDTPLWVMTCPPEERVTRLLALADTLAIGHPGGPGQIVLTEWLCRWWGLVAEPGEARGHEAQRKAVAQGLVELGNELLAPARDAGWECGDLKVETRLTRPAADGGTPRRLSLVLAPYEWLWSTTEGHPVAIVEKTMPDATPTVAAAELARLLGLLAQVLDRPWSGSARSVGWELFDSVQRRRTNRGARMGATEDGGGRQIARVVTRAAPLPDDVASDLGRTRDLEPMLDWWRGLTEEELEGATHLHSHDRHAAWCAAMNGAVLGYLTEHEDMARHEGPDAVAALLRSGKPPAGLYRLRLPAHDDPRRPAPHAAQRRDAPTTVWVTHPTVGLLLQEDDPDASLPGAGCSIDELVDDPLAAAWVFPQQATLLRGGSRGGMYETLRGGLELADTTGDRQLKGALKHLYAGWTQSTELRMRRGPEHQLQATWRATITAGHRDITWRRISAAVYRGVRVVDVANDEVVVLGRSDNTRATALTADTAAVGSFRPKAVVELTDGLRQALATGVRPLRVLARGLDAIESTASPLHGGG